MYDRSIAGVHKTTMVWVYDVDSENVPDTFVIVIINIILI